MFISRAKTLATIVIGRYRRTLPVECLAGAASFILGAFENDGTSIGRNGELGLLRRAAEAHFEVVIDAGANCGEWTMGAVKYWPGCHVHAFEVAAPTYQKLREVAREAGIESRVTIHCLGLSDHDGAAEIFYYPRSPDVTAESHRHPGVPVEVLPCTLQTGDAYLAQAGIARVDFLKIDVEGSEYKVINGFADAIATDRIQCIQFEYGAFSIDTKMLLRDYYELLGERYWIGKIYPTYVGFQDYDWRKEDFRFSNFCCVLKTRPDLRSLLQG